MFEKRIAMRANALANPEVWVDRKHRLSIDLLIMIVTSLEFYAMFKI